MLRAEFIAEMVAEKCGAQCCAICKRCPGGFKRLGRGWFLQGKKEKLGHRGSRDASSAAG